MASICRSEKKVHKDEIKEEKEDFFSATPDVSFRSTRGKKKENPEGTRDVRIRNYNVDSIWLNDINKGIWAINENN